MIIDTPTRNKANRLRAMNRFMYNSNDKSIYDKWTELVGVDADQKVFEEIAQDEPRYNKVCDLFTNLVYTYCNLWR